MVAAVSEHALHVNSHIARIRRRSATRRSARKKERPVPEDEIVKADEIAKGKFVEVEDDELEAEGYRTVDISDFEGVDEIDPIYPAQLLPHSATLKPDGPRSRGLRPGTTKTTPATTIPVRVSERGRK